MTSENTTSSAGHYGAYAVRLAAHLVLRLRQPLSL